MRFDKLTTKAQEAVVRAQEAAQQKDHAEILPLHLLAALRNTMHLVADFSKVAG